MKQVWLLIYPLIPRHKGMCRKAAKLDSMATPMAEDYPYQYACNYWEKGIKIFNCGERCGYAQLQRVPPLYHSGMVKPFLHNTQCCVGRACHTW